MVILRLVLYIRLSVFLLVDRFLLTLVGIFQSTPLLPKKQKSIVVLQLHTYDLIFCVLANDNGLPYYRFDGYGINVRSFMDGNA